MDVPTAPGPGGVVGDEEVDVTTAQKPWDVVVLGAGSGGYAAALRSAQLGQTVALVERDELGGTCLHRGCIPTKAMLHAAEVADQVREAARIGLRLTFDGVDGGTLLEHADRIVGRLHRGLQGLIRASGIEVVRGHGRLSAPDTVRVTAPDGGTSDIIGRHLVLATGSRSRLPAAFERSERIITSDEALRRTQIPRRVIVLGGGVIGVEFASLWRSLGAEVTIVEALDRLLPGEDPTISAGLMRALRNRGIDVRTGTQVRSADDSGDGVTVRLADGEVIAADVMLVAVGRQPVTEDLGLTEVGVELDEGWVRTDPQLHTGIGSIYAVGDLVRGPQLAHRGFGHGIAVAERIAGQNPLPLPDEQIPRVTYSDPEVASVGLTEPAARERFGADGVETVEYPLTGNGKSQILGTSGMVKLVRQTGGPIVGVHLLGSRVGEQIGEAQLWVGWEAYPQDITPFIHAHPTQNEALGEAALALAGQPLHAHS
ncbi:dihydrolipoyl dehydrogenase [Ruania alkalisoli]|uniref:Dihydrolipoyl dehydrogenase n=1 Tax=Ruania alkalisoli TaxID=2779775 RepID=A0A7M1SNP3_9MICO|nr:dihydrolipoyl dehydrogenase [Ruania alkalisoli]QOR69168.1 dihydrolipoyl dehydrogenase [Ruania alkalisoli]